MPPQAGIRDSGSVQAGAGACGRCAGAARVIREAVPALCRRSCFNLQLVAADRAADIFLLAFVAGLFIGEPEHKSAAGIYAAGGSV